MTVIPPIARLARRRSPLAEPPIPLVDLRAARARLRAELDAAMAEVVDRASFVMGPEVAAFEAEFAAFCGTRRAVGVASGTAALHLALRALGVGPGD
jgi:dTDP-4-amino-4,6-dideoxygalactose transaminase